MWDLVDDYQGENFFDGFKFFTGKDPTNGLVNYVTREEAFSRQLAFYDPEKKAVVMKADDTSTLPPETNRRSVRVETNKLYNSGLFILDLNTAPWGCGVWPAWWTTSVLGWPEFGEIDIIEGVHDNEHNQVAWHTANGCALDPGEKFSGEISRKGFINGTIADATNCFANMTDGNIGCSITDWSRASYGPYFDQQGGGVFVMKWDENGIAVWSFYRSAIPPDITNETPNPSSWIVPAAHLSSKSCNISKYFSNHTIIINLTFCGDWAGNTYATTKCPGSCPERLRDPKNFVNATWSINSLKVYQKLDVALDVNSTSTFKASNLVVQLLLPLAILVLMVSHLS